MSKKKIEKNIVTNVQNPRYLVYSHVWECKALNNHILESEIWDFCFKKWLKWDWITKIAADSFSVD